MFRVTIADAGDSSWSRTAVRSPVSGDRHALLAAR